MCLALPVRVVQMTGVDTAVVDLGGIRKEISLALVDEVQVGDYVILHVGYALAKLDADEAAKTLALFAQAGLAARTSSMELASGPLPSRDADDDPVALDDDAPGARPLEVQVGAASAFAGHGVPGSARQPSATRPAPAVGQVRRPARGAAGGEGA